ncbi:ABC-type polysaccharide/polyol phosphate export permease [Nocardia transvalensis]|uniref:ABC-type polysaccharide/polyol phosphate export permease n=1 Tax=Nocardia transvalensis TaxID=37333 RepID=A0A7W9UK63_9NOCA|nr:hypothetical protein [Nocardia transvalensis]MBB5915390.1 ABC-type polysaccharide/polyol phosphate export permease [Nocardia transvalensis]
MNWNTRVRRLHRALAVTFVATLVVTVAGLALSGPQWLAYLPLFPLAVLALSGLVMLVRRGGGADSRIVGGGARRLHRWSAVVFVVTVLATVVALAPEDPIVWVSYLPLLPLASLLGTGVYMFVLPHRRARAARRVATA